MDETTEARIYEAALRQTTMAQRHAMAEALAQAETLLDELTELGRYAHNATAEDRESDRLRLALALVRARRGASRTARCVTPGGATQELDIAGRRRAGRTILIRTAETEESEGR